ncbi:cysteine--tRNA ligase [Merismopedia glauca]|uniref:Cysteine--tRNA ligase n=1 Tax=Merismopedia glauca CCAP 1448/3 TaxID=1296344 RepID=A0A2T1C9F0_9CYAN|nr:cysteine--tRNA ligase [Merismopedia glauca]PSB04788.1 cysteine--tRNA ligase [Merismopedia glauca CCAP 1448/3]
MTLCVYDTLTRRQEAFTTVEPGKVKMYCCGVTVYDYCHLGHARAYIIWDTVRRYLLWRGYAVRYVQNFTDIDDKILNRARLEHSSMEAVAEKYTEAYFEDMQRLNVMDADEYPRATHNLDGIKRLIHELEHRGYAYPAEGDVYYRVGKFTSYGKLSGRSLDDLQAGASGRVEDGESGKKENPYDFALWKGAKPGEPAWESPWGAGRPGWHIECSAMVRQSLGETIDIHCGGNDLVFPHHENEIAQSEAVTEKPLARYWLHNGMVTVNGQKMSKSLGNFTTIRDLLDGKWSLHPQAVEAMAVRLFVLQADYRKPLDFTTEAIASAQNSWQTLKEALLFGYESGDKFGWGELSDSDILVEELDKFQTAVDRDFNFPSGLAVVFELAKELRINRNLSIHEGKTETPVAQLKQKWQTLVTLMEVLGLQVQLEAENDDAQQGLTDAEIASLIEQRQAARKSRNFAEGDRIRQELQTQGISLIDSPDGLTRWYRN